MRNEKICNCKMCCYFGAGDTHTHTMLWAFLFTWMWFRFFGFCELQCTHTHTQTHILKIICFRLLSATAANLLFAHFYYRGFHLDKNAMHTCNNVICILFSRCILFPQCCCFNYWLLANFFFFFGFFFLNGTNQIGFWIGFFSRNANAHPRQKRKTTVTHFCVWRVGLKQTTMQKRRTIAEICLQVYWALFVKFSLYFSR